MKTIERTDATDSLAKYAEQTQDFPIALRITVSRLPLFCRFQMPTWRRFR